MKMAYVFLIVVLLVVSMIFLLKSDTSITGNVVKDTKSDEVVGTKVKLETTKGDIVIELFDDTPITTGNFLKLVKAEFYDGVVFHRVIDGFMIQGGDPKGDGTGGPGYTIEDEFRQGNRNDRGTISMANAGPNTGGSQFFINLVDNNFLDTKHPVFGKVVEGMDVIDTIAKVSTDQRDRPVEEVRIVKASIVS